MKTLLPRDGLARRRRSRGYTVVEVLSAMTLFAIGAAGVIGMQRVTIQGGADARRFDVASNLAHQWAFRLQRDAMFWTLPNADEPTTSNINGTRWIASVPTGADWVTPTVVGDHAGVSHAFDIFGRDLAPDDPSAMFCAQYRLNWLADPGASLSPGALIHGEVRVFWARLNRAAIGSCATATPDTNPNDYHFVYVTTALRQNPSR